MNYKLFGNTGLRVSEFALGTMTFGTEWGWGCDYNNSKKIFEKYKELGGNFLDTANRYTEGTSEKYCGEFIKNERDFWVLATKYTLFEEYGNPNGAGNGKKNLVQSVEKSLKRLNTDYIDLLWVHAWDGTTKVDEILRGLDDLITSGKVLYIGISDTPAWVVSKANAIAELKNWTAFAGLQIEYSLLERTPERDLLPMAFSENMAVTPWGAIAGGALTGKYLNNEKGRLPEDSSRLNEKNTLIAKEVVNSAKELGITPSQLALKWITQQNYNFIPIVGATKSVHLEDSLKTSEIEKIPNEIIVKLNEISSIDLGFPHNFLKTERIKDIIFGGTQDKIIRK